MKNRGSSIRSRGWVIGGKYVSCFSGIVTKHLNYPNSTTIKSNKDLVFSNFKQKFRASPPDIIYENTVNYQQEQLSISIDQGATLFVSLGSFRYVRPDRWSSSPLPTWIFQRANAWNRRRGGRRGDYNSNTFPSQSRQATRSINWRDKWNAKALLPTLLRTTENNPPNPFSPTTIP